MSIRYMSSENGGVKATVKTKVYIRATLDNMHLSHHQNTLNNWIQTFCVENNFIIYIKARSVRMKHLG